MRRKIITDSSCDLNTELLKSDLITIAPFNLEVDGELFIDTLNLNKVDYLKKVETFKGTPKTSAPSPQYFYEVFKENEEAFAVTISSKLSGAYNSAISAKHMIMDDFSDKKIHIFDTKSASAGTTLIVHKLKELLEKDLDFDTIVSQLNQFIDNTKTYFYLQNFDNLVKTGRTNAYIASIAKLLNISIIGKACDGQIELLDKVRGKKKSLQKLAKTIYETECNFSEKVLSISHVESLDIAIELKELVLEKANFKDVIIQETSGLCTNYAARYGIVVSF